MSDGAGAPTAWITGMTQAHQALNRALVDLSEDQARGPSQLPGWSVGHLLSHIARNADSVVWRLAGAQVGELRDQYPGGLDQRRDDIDAGAGRTADQLVADVARSSADVERVMHSLSAVAWDAPSRTARGIVEPSRDAVLSRWREVVVHHGDLGFGPVPWPPELVQAWLPRELPLLAERTDPGALLSWVIGRGDAPTLKPW